MIRRYLPDPSPGHASVPWYVTSGCRCIACRDYRAYGSRTLYRNGKESPVFSGCTAAVTGDRSEDRDV